MSSGGSQPHDALFRHTFGQIQEAKSFFQGYLPAEITSALNWDGLKLLNSTFVDEELRKSESDMLFEIPWTDEVRGESDDPAARALYPYLLMEHQSTSYRKMPRRFLKYMMRGWDQFESEHPTAEGLPPIIPFVVAHTPGGWKLSPHFHDQILWPKSQKIRDSLKPFLPQFEHGLLDLAETPFAALLGAPAMRLTLGLLKVRCQSDGGWMDWTIPVIAQVNRTERGRELLPTMLRYLFNIPELNAKEFKAKVEASPLFDKNPETIMTIADYFRNEGLEEGLKKGREEGWQGGRQESRVEMAQMLQRILGRPVDSADTLAQLSAAQLASLVDHLAQDLSGRPN